MELAVVERLVLLNNLPEKGNVATLKIVRTLRENLSFDEEEHAKLNFRQEDDMLQWDTTDHIKDIEFGPKANSLIIEMLEKLDKEEKLDVSSLALYERFVEEKDTTE